MANLKRIDQITIFRTASAKVPLFQEDHLPMDIANTDRQPQQQSTQVTKCQGVDQPRRIGCLPPTSLGSLIGFRRGCRLRAEDLDIVVVRFRRIFNPVGKPLETESPQIPNHVLSCGVRISTLAVTLGQKR